MVFWTEICSAHNSDCIRGPAHTAQRDKSDHLSHLLVGFTNTVITKSIKLNSELKSTWCDCSKFRYLLEKSTYLIFEKAETCYSCGHTREALIGYKLILKTKYTYRVDLFKISKPSSLHAARFSSCKNPLEIFRLKKMNKTVCMNEVFPPNY